MLNASPYLAAWRAAVREGAFRAYRDGGIDPGALPLFPGGPVRLERVTFYVAPDQCLAAGTLAPIGIPDLDKLLRSTLDGLGGSRPPNGRLYGDDAQVVEVLNLSKARAPGFSGAIIIATDEGF
jgi:hypothetical protein